MKGEAWILVVEDDYDDLLLVDRARRRIAPHIPLRSARSVREAIEALHHADPALILLDMHLPGSHGLDLLQMIRTHPTASATPILCMSSQDDDATVDAAYAASANGFMVKYGDYNACFEAMCSALRYWLGTNRVPGDCGENRVYF